MLSGEVPVRHVYSHTGWRNVVDGWLYLHAGGAVGQDGQVRDVYVELNGSLEGRTLSEPPEGEEQIKAIRASLEFWKLAPETLTVPLHAAAYRAALGDTDFSEHLSGPTGKARANWLPSASNTSASSWTPGVSLPGSRPRTPSRGKRFRPRTS